MGRRKAGKNRMDHQLGGRTKALGMTLSVFTLILRIMMGVGTRAVAAEMVDRVVASVDNIAITQNDVEKQYRLERFLDGQPQEKASASVLEGVRDRLINQLLMEQEVEAEGGNLPDFSTQAEKAWEEVRGKYPSEEAFQTALEKVGMTQQEILRRLQAQERTLYLIDERLRPAAWVDLSEIESYYRETFVPEYERRQTSKPPPLEEVESQIREILIQKKINELLPDWMEEIRTGRRVKVHSF
jgi:SurA-like N-terminal domain